MGLGIIMLAPGAISIGQCSAIAVGVLFGLIWASVTFIGRARSRQALRSYGSLGLLLGFGFLLLPMGQIESTWLTLFVGERSRYVHGSCQRYPAVLYCCSWGCGEDEVIIAISELDLMSLSAVALGCATGLALFVRALSWLLQHHEDRLLSLLTGFMAIALAKLWPWQDADAKVFFEGLLWPDQYAALTGQSDYVIWVGPAAVLGFVMVIAARYPSSLIWVVVCICLSGCVPLGKPVVSERSQQPPISGNVFIVRPGDTLYSIAWRAGKDYKTLAQINGISAPFTIYPGQRLLLRGRAARAGCVYKCTSRKGQSVAERRGTDETQGPGKCPETETKDPSESKNRQSVPRQKRNRPAKRA